MCTLKYSFRTKTFIRYTYSMEFQVPQFIEVEDRVVGPLTIKQFIYLAGAGGATLLFLLLLPLFLAVLLSAPVIGLAILLAFVKINEKPFERILESMIGFTGRGKLYTWQKSGAKRTLSSSTVVENSVSNEKKESAPVTLDKIRLLARTLDGKIPE